MAEKDKKYIFILFLLLSGYYLFVFTHQLSASDAIFYLMSSRELSEGLIWEGINSYWGILISVLMVPLMWLGIKGLWAFKVIQVLIGLAGLGFLWQLGKRFNLKGALAFWAMLFGVLLIWMMSLSHTPDLLMTVLLLAYFIQIDNLLIGEKTTNGLKAGLIGGLLFLCKGYGLPFFMVHLTGLYIYLKISRNKLQTEEGNQNSNKFFLTGMMAFLIIAGSWTGILSWKYGHFTIGSSGGYNMAYMGPEMKFNPPYFDRLQNPETEFTTYFIGEEQGLFADYGKWNPVGSKSEFTYFLNRIPANISKLYYITYLRDIVFLLLIIVVLFLFYKIKISSEDRSRLWTIILFLGIYNAGYFILFPNERYLWINHILLTMVFFKGLSYLSQMRPTVNIARTFMVVAIVLFSINIQDRVQFRTIENRFHYALHNAKKDVAALQLTDKRVVSNIQPSHAVIPDYMDPTCLLMYENRFKLWGFVRSNKLEVSMLSEMTQMGIDYFFLWGTGDEALLFDTYPLVYQNQEIGLKIFGLQE